jgi:hypothetical protein
MVDALSARSPKVRRAGIAGLLALRKPESVPVLIKHLRAEPTALRGDCIKALAYITGKNFEDDTSKWSSWWRENKENFVPASTSAGAMAWRQSKAGVTFCGIRSYSRRMIFVIDASGSAAGRLSGLAGSLEKALSDASPQHMFNIICYDNNVSKLQPGLIPVAPATISQAKAWLEGREPNGKRNIFSALNVALRDPHVDTIFLVAFDGPNDGKKGRAIFDEVRKRNELRGVVIHAIGRGKAEDFLRKLAAENGGEYQTQ